MTYGHPRSLANDRHKKIASSAVEAIEFGQLGPTSLCPCAKAPRRCGEDATVRIITVAREIVAEATRVNLGSCYNTRNPRPLTPPPQNQDTFWDTEIRHLQHGRRLVSPCPGPLPWCPRDARKPRPPCLAARRHHRAAPNGRHAPRTTMHIVARSKPMWAQIGP
jgi:hypothetical protein